MDVLIAGGGASGLSAALALGRCRRRVLVCDTGRPRNATSRALRGFITRDGTPPQEFLRMAREELGRYPCIELRSVAVEEIKRRDKGFDVTLADGSKVSPRMVLLATGIIDEMPPVPGFERFYGRGVHQCPYCDGWEHRDQVLAVYGGDAAALSLAAEVRQWSRHLVLCTDGGRSFSAEESATLRRTGMATRHERVLRLEGDGDALQRIVFEGAPPLECAALFFSPRQRQHSPLGKALGCAFNDEDQIECDERQQTSVPGVFAVGNAARGLQLVIIAAAEGTKAAFAVNEALCEQDFEGFEA